MIVKFDSLNRMEQPLFFLCNPGSTYEDGKLSNVIGGITNTEAEENIFNFNAPSELNMRVNRPDDDSSTAEPSVLEVYEAIENRRLIFISNIGFFVISHVDETKEENRQYKDITAQSLEKEIEQKEVPYIEDGTYPFSTINDKIGLFDKIVQVIPSWTVGHVDASVASKYRTFEDVGTDLNCYSFMINDMQSAYECIFEFDSVNRQISVYDQANYVKRTNIHISNEDVVDVLKISDDSEDLYTAIHVSGVNDLNIAPVNPIGGNTIYDFSYYLDWMSPGLRAKITEWADRVEWERGQHYPEMNYRFYSDLYYYALEQVSTTRLNIEALDTQIDIYNRCRSNVVASQAGEDEVTEHTVDMTELYNEALDAIGGSAIIVDIDEQVEDLLSDIDDLIAAANSEKESLLETLSEAEDSRDSALQHIEEISVSLSLTNILTESEYEELSKYIFEANYNDEYITVTDSMTLGERMSQMDLLYTRAVEQLRRISKPKREFSIDVESFVFEKEFGNWTAQLETGCLIDVDIKEGETTSLFLSSITINYDDKSMTLKFGSGYDKYDTASLFNDVLGSVSKSANSINYIKEQIYPIKVGKIDELREAIENARALSMTNALAAQNQAFVIDGAGITGRKVNESNLSGFDDQQVKMTSNLIVFTDDAWQTCKVAIGDLGNGQYGINAETIIGNLIIGNDLILSGILRSANNTFVLNMETGELTMTPLWNSDISTAVAGVESDLNTAVTNLQNQIDGAIETYSGSYAPTLSNYPASSWSQSDYDAHVGDLFVGDSGSDIQGFWYRFQYNNSTDTYSWVQLKDNDIQKAIQDAADAVATANAASDTADDALTKANASVQQADVEYYKSTSSSTQTGGSWQSTSPTWENGYYIWTRTKFTPVSGAVYYSNPVCITGNTGASGSAGSSVSITGTSVQYAENTSPTNYPTSGWGNSIPDVPDGHYLWTKTTVDYNTGDSTVAYSVSYKSLDGDPGAPGAPGTSSYTYIRYSAYSNGINPSTSQPSMSSTPSADYEYIGICVTNSATAPTTASSYQWSKYLGDDGEPGNGIDNIYYKYAVTPTQAAPSASNESLWVDTIPPMSASNKYLWQREIIDYTDASAQDKTTVILLAVYGDTGRSITGVTEYYKKSSDGANAPSTSTTWSTTPTTETLDSTYKYLWNYESISYSSGNPTTTTPKVVAIYSQDGRGISSVTNWYLATDISSSGSLPAHGQSPWTTTVQTPSSSAQFLWNYEVIEYTTGEQTTTNPCIIGNYSSPGDSAVTYSVTPSVFAVVRDSIGNPTPSSITFTATKTVGAGSPESFSGVFAIETSSNGTSYSAVSGTGTSIKSSESYTVAAGVKFIRCRLYANASKTAILDEQSVAVVSDGANGTSYYTYVRYSQNSDGNPMVATPTSTTKYIGVYSGTSASIPVYSAFTWSKYAGDDGAPGEPGSNGKTYYTWIKYADNASGDGMSDNPSGKAYIGIATNKESATESAVPSDYTWSKYVGNNGTSYYTYIRYADDNTGSGMSTSPTGKSYLGIHTGTETTAPSSASSYVWSKYVGDDGLPGEPGNDGQTLYTWIKYADDANGTNMSDSPTGKKYIGIAYNKTTSSESSTASDYTWSKYVGEDGHSSYTYVRYSANSSGNPMVTTPSSNTKYIGLYTGTSASVPAYSAFTWSKYAGEDGSPGEPGDDGKTFYTWIKYADDASGNGMADSPAGKKYIGIATNKESATESTTASDYTWSKYVGDNGTSYYTYIRYADDSSGGGMSASPSGKSYLGIHTGTETTAPTSASSYVWSKYVGEDGLPGEPGDNGITFYTWIKYADDANGTNMSNSPVGKKYIGIAYNKESSTESNVASDYTWSRYTGEDGEDAYTVIFTNENHTFVKGVAGSTTCQVLAYKGSSQIACTLPADGTSVNLPSGMTYTRNNNGTTTSAGQFTISTSTSFASANGTLDIDIVVDGKTFEKKFSYSLVENGTSVTVTDTEIRYVAWDYGDEANKPGDSANWQSTVPAVNEGQYLWTRTKVIFSQGEPAVSYSVAYKGTNGRNGTSSYTHIRYANSANPTTWSQSPTGMTYIGIAITDSPTAPTSASSYTWSKYVGDDGDPGNGIDNIYYKYMTTTTQTAPSASSSSWGDNIPVLSATNKYLWQRQTIDFSDSGVADQTTVVLLAVYGDTGRSITGVTEYYKKHTNATTAPTGTWSTSPEMLDSTYKYLWNYEEITYSSGNPTTTDKKVVAIYSQDGVSITGVTNWYLATNVSTSSGLPTKGQSPWTTTVQIPDATNNYLWNYEVISYSSGNPTSTDPCIIGNYAKDGSEVTIYSISPSVNAIVKNGSTFTPSSVTFTAKSQTGSGTPANYSGRFIIAESTNGTSYTNKYTSSSNESSKAYTPTSTAKFIRCSLYKAGGTTTLVDQETVAIVSDGANGTNGTDGTSITITSTSVTYQAGDSGTAKPTGTWSTTVPSVSQGQYLWTKTVVTYSDGSSTEAYSVSRNAVNGTNGTNGTSPTVTSTLVEYQQSSSGTTVPTGTWSTTPPSATAGYYMWTRTTVTYSDNVTSVSYSVGKNGTNGTSATAYSLIVSHAAVVKGTSGTYNPSAITLTAKSQTGSSAMANYSGRFKIETTTDNSTWTAKYTSSSNQSSYSYTVPADIIAIRCSLYLAGGTTTLLDQQIVPIVSDGTNGTSVTITAREYQQGDSATTAPTGTWSTSVVSVAEGKYLWTRITYSDSSVSYSVAKQGVAGTSVSISSIQYQEGASSTTAPTGTWSNSPVSVAEGKFLWTKVTYSNGSVSYSVARQGENGTNGTNGVDGKDAYTVILSNESHSFAGSSTAAIAGSATCSVIAYKGATQVAATIGTISGAPTGMSTSISNNSSTSASFTVTVTTSMVTKNGVLTVPVTVDGKAFTKQFTYSLALAGTNGSSAVVYSIIPSANAIVKNASGTLNPSSVTFTAKSKTGTGNPENYSGRFIIAESTDGSSYTNKYTSSANEASKAYTPSANTVKFIRCSLYLAGGTSTLLDQETVAVVSDGTNGTNGISITITKTEYQQGDNATTAPTGTWSTSVVSVAEGKYLWTRVTYSDNSVSYSVAKQGVSGSNGAPGTSVTVSSIQYQSGTSNTTAPTGTWSNSPVSVSAGNYLWTKVTYSDNTVAYSVARQGSNGTDGKDAYTVILTNENHTFVGGTSAAVAGSTECQVIAYKGATQVAATIGTISGQPTGMTTSISNNGSTSAKFTVTVTTSMTTKNGVLTVPVTVDSKSFSMKFTYSLALAGANGNDAYTVILTNENHTFAGSTLAALASSTECQVIAYKGTTQVAATIGTITGQPTGMTTSISNNGTTTAKFTVSVTTSMVSQNGVLAVPVTVDSKTFNMKFTYSLALAGAKGDAGVNFGWNLMSRTQDYSKLSLYDCVVQPSIPTNILYIADGSVTADYTKYFAIAERAAEGFRPYSEIRNRTITASLYIKGVNASPNPLTIYSGIDLYNASDGSGGRQKYTNKPRAVTLSTDWQLVQWHYDVTDSIFVVGSGSPNYNSCYYRFNFMTYTGEARTDTTGYYIKEVKWEYGSEPSAWAPRVDETVGTGISSIRELYYCSSSSTAPSAPTATSQVASTKVYGQWTSEIPDWTETYQYYYTCSEVHYDDGSIEWSTPVGNSAYNQANQVASNAADAANEAQNTADLAMDTAGQAQETAEGAAGAVSELSGEVDELSGRVDSAEGTLEQLAQNAVTYNASLASLQAAFDSWKNGAVFQSFYVDTNGVHIAFTKNNDSGEILMDGANIRFFINGAERSLINADGFNFDYGIITTALQIGKSGDGTSTNGTWTWTKAQSGHFRLVYKG